MKNLILLLFILTIGLTLETTANVVALGSIPSDEISLECQDADMVILANVFVFESIGLNVDCQSAIVNGFTLENKTLDLKTDNTKGGAVPLRMRKNTLEI